MDARPPTSTLARLRAAGQAGWKDDYLYVEGTVFRIVGVPQPGGSYRIRIRPSDLPEDSALLRDGWSRMPHVAAIA